MKLEIENWQAEIQLRFSTFLLILFSIVWLGTQVGQSATADNPYQAIATRNVFGLVPIPTGPPPSTEPPPSLPKITPNGMMTIFGKLQVLFKVTVPGQPAGKEASYVMSEGDRQDDIEVQKIDEKSATITFNNHGTIQTLALTEGKATGGTPPPAAPGAGGIPRLPNVPGRPAGGGAATPIAFGGHFGHGNTESASSNLGSGLDEPSSANANGQAAQPPLSPEAAAIMVEANRMKAIDAGDSSAPLFPITPITQEVLGQQSDGSVGGANSGGPGAPGGPSGQ